MVTKAHQHLISRYKWYENWHSHSHASLLHWGILILLSLLIFLTAQITIVNKLNITSDAASKIIRAKPDIIEKTFRGKIKNVAKDRLLIKFKDNVPDKKKNEIISKYAGKEKSEISGTKIKIITIPSNKDPKGLAKKIESDNSESVAFVEADQLISPQYIPNDFYFPNQFYITETQTEYAWDHGTSSGVLIGLCDTGVDGSHQDLSGRIRLDLGFNTVNNSTDFIPSHAHGTMVSGVLSAIANNSIGIAGVSHNASIIPIKISMLSDGAAYYSDAAECIAYAAEKGAKTINLSYRMADSATIDQAASYAESRGAVTFVAAGNEGIDTGWPDFPSFVAVGGSISNSRWFYSNYGTYIDIVAPSSGIYTTGLNDSYAKVSGTSFASPIVAGIATILYAERPSLSPSELKSILYTTTDDLGTAGEDNEFGSGRINARKALEKALNITIPYPTAVPTPGAITPTPISDTIPPSPITNLSFLRVATRSAFLRWQGTKDNLAIKEYRIYLGSIDREPNTNKLEMTIPLNPPQLDNTNTRFDANVMGAPQETYKFHVITVDVAGNMAKSTSEVAITFLPEAGKGIVTGRVTDENGNALPDVKISFGGNSKLPYWKTGLDGTFKTQVIPVGTYKVTLTKNGYANYSTKLSLTQTGEIGTLNAVMKKR